MCGWPSINPPHTLSAEYTCKTTTQSGGVDSPVNVRHLTVPLLRDAGSYLSISCALYPPPLPAALRPYALACYCYVWQASDVLQDWHQFKEIFLMKTSCCPPQPSLTGGKYATI